MYPRMSSVVILAALLVTVLDANISRWLLVVRQGSFWRMNQSMLLGAQVVLDPPVQVAALIVAVFDDNVVLEDCRHRLDGDRGLNRKCCANPVCKLCFSVQRLVPLSIFDV